MIFFFVSATAVTTYIDSSAVQALKDLHHEYRSRHIQVTFSFKISLPIIVNFLQLHYRFCFQIAISNPNNDVLLTLAKAGLIDMIGAEWYFVRIHDAVQVCLQHVQRMIEEPHQNVNIKSNFWETRVGESNFMIQPLLGQNHGQLLSFFYGIYDCIFLSNT